MRISVAIAAAAVLAILAAPVAGAAPATVATSTATTATPASKAATRAYDLDFTLPTAGKSGCLVCHGDESLQRISIDATSSIWVDTNVLQTSAHKNDTPCTGCHLDFAYTAPHRQVDRGDDWLGSAKAACKNCHTEVFSEYANGAHSPAGQPGTEASVTAATRRAEGKPATVPQCGDCHGGHSIPASDNVEAQDALHRSGNAMCGQQDCHVSEAGTYEDYYHGAAYRRGSLDAPSCWDCHGFHDIIPASERISPVHPSRLSETCGQEGCHKDADDPAFLAYAELIHGQQEIRSENPVVAIVDRVKHSIRSALRTVRAWF